MSPVIQNPIKKIVDPYLNLRINESSHEICKSKDKDHKLSHCFYKIMSFMCVVISSFVLV